MSYAAEYRENVTEARTALARTQEKFDRLKRAEFIFWGRIKLKSGNEYEGWLVKGKAADEAFTERARAGADLMHWLRLLAAEEATTAMPDGKESRDPMSLEQQEARKREIAAQVAARLGEKIDDDEAPF